MTNACKVWLQMNRPGLDGRILLQCALRMRVWRFGLDSYGSGYDFDVPSPLQNSRNI